jgi:hypothetical protein
MGHDIYCTLWVCHVLGTVEWAEFLYVNMKEFKHQHIVEMQVVNLLRFQEMCNTFWWHMCGEIYPVSIFNILCVCNVLRYVYTSPFNISFHPSANMFMGPSTKIYHGTTIFLSSSTEIMGENKLKSRQHVIKCQQWNIKYRYFSLFYLEV